MQNWGSNFLKISKIFFVILFLIPCFLNPGNCAFAKHELAGPVYGKISSPFGMRADPYSGKMKFHSGLDFAADYGTPIYAIQDGTVTFSGRKGNYGNCIILDHYYPDVPQIPHLETLYGHISKLLVKNGESVKRGQIIAYVGSTGRSTGPHLHFEVRYNNSYVDPVDYIYKLPSYLDYVVKVRSRNRYTSYKNPGNNRTR